MLATTQFLDQNRLDDFAREESLRPPRNGNGHRSTIHLSSSELAELAAVQPNFGELSYSSEVDGENERELSPEFRKALRREVSRVLRTLSEEEQIVIRLMYMRKKGLSEAEVASKMNTTEAEVMAIKNIAFAGIFEKFSRELAVRFIDGQQ